MQNSDVQLSHSFHDGVDESCCCWSGFSRGGLIAGRRVWVNHDDLCDATLSGIMVGANCLNQDLSETSKRDENSSVGQDKTFIR